MGAIQQIEDRREQILNELRSVRELRRGSITEQTFEDKRKKGAKPVIRGPYLLFSRREGGKTVSRRLQPGEDLDLARRLVAEHKRFVALCEELARLTEQLGDLQRGEGALEEKRRRSSSSKTAS